MLWNQIVGLSKFTGLFNAIKELANALSSNPHKHPLTYVFITTILVSLIPNNNSDMGYFIFYETLIFLLAVVLFYSLFYSFSPWIKTIVNEFFAQRQAIEYFDELTYEQKCCLLDFFPNPNVKRLVCVHHDDFYLRELIEYKILISDSNLLYYDEYINYHFVNVNVAKYILKIMRKNNLFEIWKAEKEAEDIKIKESDPDPF